MNSTRLEILSKDNYDTWQIHAQALLIKNDHWKYVSGESTKPELSSPPTAQETTAQQRWIQNDLKARSDILLSISASELKHTRGCNTSLELWQKIESVYAPKGPARMASLLKQLLQQKMQEGAAIREHLAQFFDAVDKLANMEVDINDKLLTLMLLQSLPSSFDMFKRAIESRDELPELEILKVKIIEASESIKDNFSESGHRALYAKPGFSKNFENKNDQAKSWEKNKRRNYVCGYCKKKGHKTAECFAKKKADQKKTEKPQANTVETSFMALATDSKSALSINSTAENFADLFSEEEAMCITDRPDDSHRWCLDSGCTTHLCKNRELFSTLEDASSDVKLANGANTHVSAKGEITLKGSTHENDNSIKLENTLFVPELKTNLVSVAKIVDRDHEVSFQKTHALVRDLQGNVKLIADRVGDLFYVRESISHALNATTSKSLSIDDWHERFGHINKQDLITMHKRQVAIGINLNKDSDNKPCQICILGKLTSAPFQEREEKSANLLDIVHADVCGPMHTQSLNGARYFLTLIDDHSGWCELFFLRKKSEVATKFAEYLKMAETHTGCKLKFLQSDNGTEFCNSSMDTILKEKGIRRRLTAPHTPQQNGVAERRNRTLVDSARCMLIQSGLPPSFWAEAVSTANYLRNRCISKPLGSKTPYETRTGNKPNLSHLRTFGCEAFVLDKNPKRGKFEPKAKQGKFIGYSQNAKAYRIWVPNDRKVHVSRDVKFVNQFGVEEKFEDFISSSTKIGGVPILTGPNGEQMDTVEVPLHSTGSSNQGEQEVLSEAPKSEVATPQISKSEKGAEVKRTPGRPKIIRTGKRGRPRKEYNCAPVRQPDFSQGNDDEQHADNNEQDEDDEEHPKDWQDAEKSMLVCEVPLKQAISGPNREEWKDSIFSEIKSLIVNYSFDLVLRENNRVIGCRLVLRNKYNADGTLERRKARLVAQGFSQRPGIDYHDTFAPVARLNSLRTLLALSAETGMKLAQLDVTTAYLNGHIDTTIYMEKPVLLEEMLTRIIHEEGQTPLGRRAQEMLSKLQSGDHVCLLKKAVYGLKQSGRQWYSKLNEVLGSYGFQPTNADPCVYSDEDKKTFVLIYVDDFIIAYSLPQRLASLKKALSNEFKLKDLGEAKFCLGIEIAQQSKGKYTEIQLSQTGYVRELLERFGMQNCKPVNTPLSTGSKADDPEDASIDAESFPYRELVGGLMYLAIGTRPDIAHAVSYLSQFNSDPQQSHWIAAKRVLRYLKGTMSFSLTYNRTGIPLRGYVDADWGGCPIDRRSYTGFTFVLAGGSISWESRKQRTVALSSTEAEYMALSEAVKESLFLNRFLNEIGFSELSQVDLYCDNQGAAKLARNPVFHNKSKHIDIRYHFVQQSIKEYPIDLKYLRTEEMISDALTKGLPGPKHQFRTKSMGLQQKRVSIKGGC